MNAALHVAIESIGLIGPGLSNWNQAAAVLRGESTWQDVPIVIPSPQQLPAAERRRVGSTVKLAMAVAGQVFDQASMASATTATVFTSSSGDGETCHQLSEALTTAEPLISPTRFTNSVHNVPAGYWSIATGSRAMSTSLCAHDGSFCAGLIEAAVLACTDDMPVALIAYEIPYPEPIRASRPIEAACGIAMLLWPVARLTQPLARLSIGTRISAKAALSANLRPTPMRDPGLEALRQTTPAARALPLLAQIACSPTSGQSVQVMLDAGDGNLLPIDVLH